MSASSSSQPSLRPEHGVRVEVVRGAGDLSGVLIYRGHAHTPQTSWPIEVRVSVDAAKASIDRGDLTSPELDALEKSVSALVRAATRSHLIEGRTPPRKIVRWRA